MVPASTYRLQIRPDLDLTAAAELVDYLAALGVTHLYSAPLLGAAPGSAHGYDVVDPTRINPQLGGPRALDRLVQRLRAAGMGLVLDIVPNHLGVAVPEANPAWWSVLREGRDSPYAAWFDIDWDRPLILPVLGDEPDALDALRVIGDELRYHDHRYPLAPGTGGGDPRQVHERQHYRLVNWRRGNSELNYRRFFAVSELAAVRVEDPAVFDATHAEILRWYAAGAVDGLRVDHPDGLRDPAGYLRRLAERAPDAWLLVEKILGVGERLPLDWPVAGTTGYDALGEVSGLFVDPAAEADFPAEQPWQRAAYLGKREVATTLLAAEVARIARLAPEVPDAAPALVELAARFPVYRSYLPAGAGRLRDARDAADPTVRPALDALWPRLSDPGDELALRFQQLTGAVMAKGVEDTAGYRWNRFVALNEVGGSPQRFGMTVEEFHRAATARQEHWPATMTTLSTHDTKRSEDVRARLAVLSEMPAQWRARVASWSAAAPLPDPDLADLLWQTVVGAWPIERERLRDYARKAAREAATHTRWDAPQPAFEDAVRALVDACFDDPVRAGEVADFAASIASDGWSNALGQKLVQLTMPGVPDTYQGTELWDNSLVDPDNRRPVDFAARRTLLTRLDEGWLPPVDGTGAAKLLLVSRVLRLRRDRPQLFSGYRPVRATGAAAGHVIAFDRGGVVAVATRLPRTLGAAGGWDDTTLALHGPRVTDILTGGSFAPPRLRVADLLSTYPVALLVET
ncbi:malto-oligosyltrehalose synthase [Rugosimonospora acidiphila]|uniref:Malto-oligosyltrehalose synthase n=1 Tax=Rugosimonospora acidiphila TaxID=556531 RepID=A0ABP9RLB8_9ACTN